MPRYQYVCTTCKLQDVKNIIYKSDDEGNQCRICPDCGNMLKRKFIRPPQGWFNQARQGDR